MAYNIDFTDIKNAVDYVNRKIEHGDFYRIKSGLKVLDMLKGGWFRGEFSVIGARPGIGKKGFILSIISNLLHDDIPISLFSATDVMNEDFIAYIVSCIKYYNLGTEREKRLDFLKAVDVAHIPLFLNLQPRMTLSYIRDNARILVENHGVKCIFIDGLQNIFDSEENGNQKEGMEQVCHELKLIARDLNVPLIVTSDLNRAIEHREGIAGKEPQMFDLRGSSAIENDADSILMLHRPSYYGIYQDERGNDMHDIECIYIHKNRYGSIGEVQLKYCQRDATVEELWTEKRME